MSKDMLQDVSEGLKHLKLPNIRLHLEDHLRLSESKSQSHLEFLYGLIKDEITGRERSNLDRRMKQAHFPVIKRFDNFDFTFQPSISVSRINNVRECRFIENAENIVFAGQTGVGKSHLALALGVEAIERGYKIFYTTVADLLDEMKLASTIGQLSKLQQKLLKFDALIIDELGYVQIDRLQGNFLFHLISKAYERTSIILTTNKDFSGWTEIFEDKIQVSAMLDRLLHHVNIFVITGESYRIKGPKR
jgi:DNA replication protein DnaC